MVAKGFFIVADITGYTAFLTKVELDHAEMVLDALFKVQIDHFNAPITVNSFRGDGILAYALEGGFVDGKTLIERLNQVYFSYSSLREMMYMNVTCPCAACANIKDLDLKLFVHHGNFMLQKVGDREEMLGPDVIVVHRMMKNEVKEQTGIQAYVLITEAAAESLDFGDLLEEMIPYTDEYEHIGQVRMLTYDLHKAYMKRREEKRVIITADIADISHEMTSPVSAVKIWDFLVDPNHKREWCKMSDRDDPTLGMGNSYKELQARHDFDLQQAAIIDFRQYELCTVDGAGFGDSRYQATFLIKPNYVGCKVEWDIKITKGDVEKYKPLYEKAALESLERLRTMIETVHVDA